MSETDEQTATRLGEFEGHTPGPWDDSGHDGKTAIIVLSKWGEVARVRSHADAKLIAAAPSLLRERDQLRERVAVLERALWSIINVAFDPANGHKIESLAVAALDAGKGKSV